MFAGFPLNAAYALPVASAAASCSGVTSVTAVHCASLFTRKSACYPELASARKRSARSWIGDFVAAKATKGRMSDSRNTSLRRAPARQERKRQEILGRCISAGYPKPTKIVKRGFLPGGRTGGRPSNFVGAPCGSVLPYHGRGAV